MTTGVIPGTSRAASGGGVPAGSTACGTVTAPTAPPDPAPPAAAAAASARPLSSDRPIAPPAMATAPIVPAWTRKDRRPRAFAASTPGSAAGPAVERSGRAAASSTTRTSIPTPASTAAATTTNGPWAVGIAEGRQRSHAHEHHHEPTRDVDAPPGHQPDQPAQRDHDGRDQDHQGGLVVSPEQADHDLLGARGRKVDRRRADRGKRRRDAAHQTGDQLTRGEGGHGRDDARQRRGAVRGEREGAA